MSRFSKAIAAAIAALGVTSAALADGAVTVEEVVAMAAAWLGVVAVYRVRNKPAPLDPSALQPDDASRSQGIYTPDSPAVRDLRGRGAS